MSNVTPEDVKQFTDFNVLMNDLLHDWEKMTDEKRKRRAQKMVIIYMNLQSAVLAKTLKAKLSAFPNVNDLFKKEYQAIDKIYEEVNDNDEKELK